MAGDYTRWYREGTITLAKNSTKVTGKDTYWNTAGLHPGDIFSVDATGQIEIVSIEDNTHLTLATAYTGDALTNHSYYIIRNFNSNLPAQTAAQVVDLLGDVKQYIDSKQGTITGKSAYEIAKDEGYTGTKAAWVASLKGDSGTNGTNGKSAYELAQAGGYTGTQAEWLESLKAAGEWSALDERTANLTIHNAATHNGIYRGKNLGTSITEEQYAEIRAGRYRDLYIGDYWTHNAGTNDSGLTTQRYIIAGFEYLAMHVSNISHASITNPANSYSGELTGRPAGQTNRRLAIICGTPWPGIRIFTGGEEAEGYANCYWRTEGRKPIRAMIESFFGADHIMHYVDNLQNSNTSNRTLAGYECDIELLQASMVLGYDANGEFSGDNIMWRAYPYRLPIFNFVTISQIYPHQWLFQTMNKGSILGMINNCPWHTKEAGASIKTGIPTTPYPWFFVKG